MTEDYRTLSNGVSIVSLPDSYTQKPGAISNYFEAFLAAQAPERFSIKFLKTLGFNSTNDRLIIPILKDLGFLDTDANPTDRYYLFHDRSQWQRVLADGIRDAYSDLFATNQEAYNFDAEEVANKLRTLYAGSKTDLVISRIARTFTGLCEIADFESPSAVAQDQPGKTNGKPESSSPSPIISPRMTASEVSLDSLQYHINIVLPESRDQAVYDALFKSLREHLG